MTGENAEVIDPSKNPELLFTQRQKPPGMRCITL